MSIPDKNCADYSASPSFTLNVPSHLAGKRLDQILAELLPQYSRNRLQGWIRAGQLQVDGAPESEVRRKLHGGETLDLNPVPDERECAGAPEDIALDVIHEDEALLIINKPAGLVVHPGSGNWSGTMMNALLHHFPAIEAVPRAGIVHRLDKETSGLLVVAKTLEAQTDLVRQLQARSLKRQYLAVALGHPRGSGTVNAPIGRHPVQRIKMAVLASGKPAVTHFKVLEQFARCALIECSLETGRTHQIRVHMMSIGHPLLGDPVYGKTVHALPPFPRQALHARRLGLIHPHTGDYCEWEAPVPDDFETLLTALRQDEAMQ